VKRGTLRLEKKKDIRNIIGKQNMGNKNKTDKALQLKRAKQIALAIFQTEQLSVVCHCHLHSLVLPLEWVILMSPLHICTFSTLLWTSWFGVFTIPSVFPMVVYSKSSFVKCVTHICITVALILQAFLSVFLLSNLSLLSYFWISSLKVHFLILCSINLTNMAFNSMW
jgi:hypothetical protein